MSTQNGLHGWARTIYAEIFKSLTQNVQQQVKPERHGDLTALMADIRLANRRYEVYNPSDLKKVFFGLTMKVDGKQNIMKFFAKVEEVVARLAGVDAKPSDTDIMTVMKDGVDQDIFEGIIDLAEEGKYSTSQDFKQAILRKSARPKFANLLANLDPECQEHTLVTEVVDRRRKRGRSEIQQLQEQVFALQEQIRPKRNGSEERNWRGPDAKRRRTANNTNECYEFRDTGRCNKFKCNFAHDKVSTNTRTRPAGRATHGKIKKYCKHHVNSSSHDTHECRSIQSDPELRKAFNVERDRSTAAIHAAEFEPTYEHVFTVQHETVAHINAAQTGAGTDARAMTCVDGASTAHTSNDATECYDVVKCNVLVKGANSEDNSFVCQSKGKRDISLRDATTGEESKLLTTEVLIDDRFPFSIFSEIAMQRERSDTITKTMEKGKWTFVGANKNEIFQARQLLPNTSELYFINGISDVRNAPVGNFPKTRTILPAPSRVLSE